MNVAESLSTSNLLKNQAANKALLTTSASARRESLAFANEMKVFGKYPTELCQDYAKALRAAGIKCTVRSPEAQLLASDRGLYEYSQLLVDEKKSKRVQQIIAQHESLATSRVREIEKQAAQDLIFAVLVFMAFLSTTAGILGFLGRWNISNVVASVFLGVSTILGIFAYRKRKNLTREPAAGGNG